MLHYDRIKNIPTSRDGKMVYGITAALVARLMLNQGIATLPVDSNGALIAFLMTGVLLFTVGLAIARYDTGRPLFEPLKRG
jgi:hypothetical protein